MPELRVIKFAFRIEARNPPARPPVYTQSLREMGMEKSFWGVALALPIVAAAWSVPMQLGLQVPFEPTAFTGSGRTVVMYELHLTNYSNQAIDLRRIEVFDADDPGARPLVTFDGAEIGPLLQAPAPPQVNAGATVVVFMQVTLDSKADMPNRLRHRVSGADSSIEGALIGTHRSRLKVLVPPVRGAEWQASDGPSNDRDNHHRRGLLVLDGRATISRRFATDWFLKRNGRTYDGDIHAVRAHHSYEQPVFAVARGTVVATRDDRPDNVPGFYPDFIPPADLSLETATGNLVIVDIGDGLFAHYYHLQPGSLRVKPGDRVASGQPLARIGTSGDANLPHLHFEVTTSPLALMGEGVPYVIDRFRAKSTHGGWQTITRELPMRNMLIDFGQRR
jgi:murein DD-endopeptidase MepM/ murein hydrolase activator NlpD